MDFRIREMTPDDWKQVKEIYKQGLETGVANFYENAPSWQAWDRGHLEVGRIVACDEADLVLGWAALSPVSGN